MPGQRKKRIVALASVAVLLLTAVLIAVITSGPRVRILDPHFQIVAFKFIHAKQDKVYWGNQLEGKMWDQLHKLGLRVKILPQNLISARTNSYTFSVMYRGEFIVENSIPRVQAELVFRTGTIIPLRWVSGGADPKKTTYLGNWVLDPAPTNINRCTVRLSRPADNHRLAEIDVSSSNAERAMLKVSSRLTPLLDERRRVRNLVSAGGCLSRHAQTAEERQGLAPERFEYHAGLGHKAAS